MRAGYWNNLNHHRSFLDSVAQTLNITEPAQWYKVTIQNIRQLGGSGLLDKYEGSLRNLLKTVYPEYQKACTHSVMKLMKQLNLNKVEELVSVPKEYLTTSTALTQ